MEPRSSRRPSRNRRRISRRPGLLQRRIGGLLVPDLGNVEFAVREVGVAQPKAELEARSNVERVKVPVVDVEAVAAN